MNQDSTGKLIKVGDRVRFRGEYYTIKAFGPSTGILGTPTIIFREPLHINETPDEINVDLVEGARH